MLYLLCGLPFCGKSTLARRLRDECGFEVVSLDAINEERGLFGEDGLPVAEWEATNLVARGRVKEIMKNRRDVVVDDTNCYRWIRDRWRDLAALQGYDSLVVFFPAAPEELRERMASSNRRAITPDVFDACVRTFEPPSGENAIELATPQQVGTFIESRRIQ